MNALLLIWTPSVVRSTWLRKLPPDVPPETLMEKMGLMKLSVLTLSHKMDLMELLSPLLLYAPLIPLLA